jgi:hypothetical protein
LEIPKEVHYLSAFELKETVDQWMDTFKSHRILLSFNEQEIDYKRRYTFIKDVFLNLQLPVHPPEMYFCFLYDHYQPAVFPEAPEALVGDLLQSILGISPAKKTATIYKRIKLNQFHNLSEPEFRYVLDCHHKKYDSVAGISLSHEDKTVYGNRLILMGSHTTGICQKDFCTIHRGKWRVEMLRIDGKWQVSGIFIEGIEF